MQDHSSRVSSVFATVLSAGREHFNAQYAAARRQYGELEPSVFTDYLKRVVDPLVSVTAQLAPESVAEVAQAAYDAGLELCGQRLYGAPNRQHFSLGFARLLHAYAARIVEAPRGAVGALGNALHNVSAMGGNSERFAEQMVSVAEHVPDVPTLLLVGQVQAWRAGLAHFRHGALDALARLPNGLMQQIMGSSGSDAWLPQLNQLQQDAWFDPSLKRRATERWVGAFRGFGGLFPVPPRVTSSNGELLVQAGKLHWLLLADAFGATFHRASDAEVAAGLPTKSAALTATVTRDGKLRIAGDVVAAQPRGEITSSVEANGTLAVTFSASHAILLCPGARSV